MTRKEPTAKKTRRPQQKQKRTAAKGKGPTAAASPRGKQAPAPAATPAEPTSPAATAAPPVVGQDLKDFSFGSQADVTEFLRAALKADPTTAAGKAALRTAEAAALRLARDLRRQARTQTGPLRAALEQQANENYFRAVLAKQLPHFIEALRRPIPTRVPGDEPPAQALLPALTAPTDVTAEAGALSATVRWSHPPAEVATSFAVTPFVGEEAQLPTPAGGAQREIHVLGLTAGTSYRFQVVASRLAENSPPSALSNTVTPVEVTSTGGVLDLSLPSFSSDPALLIDKDAKAYLGYVADATRISQKWRYEHLKIQAVAAAREAMQYEEHIARLMAMAVDKLGTAEEIFNATLLQAVSSGQTIERDLIEAGTAPELKSLLEPLGEAAGQSLLLPRFLAWLIETGPLKFWIGLFEAMISDLASVVPIFGSATTFGRTKKYIRNAFKSDFDGLRENIQAAARDLLMRLDAEVDQMLAPLRAATAEVVAGTRKAMADVFEGFDITLLLTPPKAPGRPEVPDLDPLEGLYAQLSAPIDDLANRLKGEIRPKLEALLADELAADSLFEKIVIAFLVLPILAFLVISLAGGPFSAALLAAAVLLAAEELLRLLVQWLAGPLLKKVGELNARLNELVGQLQGFFAQQAALVRNQSPVLILQILAGQLRELRDFLPQTFLEDAAGILQEARNVVLRTATQLGLAAEQALGQENATAFEAVGDDFTTRLAPAPQLPGGTDPSRLAGAALLRDFGRLEEQRMAIRDGKEVEFTHRLSLARLLGGDLTQLVQKRELLVSLTERDLLDRMFPGVYRALIKEVRVTGVVGGAIDPRLYSVPLSITHLGESRTRIKRSANPSAPPVALPDCFPKSAGTFSVGVVGQPPFRRPGDLENTRRDVLFGPGDFGGPDALEVQLKRAFDRMNLTLGFYGQAYLVGLVLSLLGSIDDIDEWMMPPFRRALLDHLLESLERRTELVSCGNVDPSSIVAAARVLINRVKLGDVIMPALNLSEASQNPNKVPSIDSAIPIIAERLQRGRPTVSGADVPGLVAVAQEAWREAADSLYRRIARWGDAELEEDPDPQVRALGFVRLVRRAPSETMLYNLFTPSPPVPPRAEAAFGVSDGPPFVPAPALQYRPFENRGIEGDLLLRLESLDDDALMPLGAGGLVQQLSRSLTDIVLDITVRGCYDPNLAQTVRASRRQTAAGFNVASRIPGALGAIGLPDSLVRVEAGASELRTVRYSLRAHRDKTLQVLTAAVTRPSPPTALLELVNGKSMLGRDAAYEPLKSNVKTFDLELSGAALANTVAALEGLVGKLRVSPADLGLDASVLAGRTEVEAARLVGMGVAVIPMPDGVRAVDAEPDDPAADPLGIKLHVTGLLGNVFPGFAALTPLPRRLSATDPRVGGFDPPRLADLFAAATPPTITLDLAGALGTDTEASRLYDVILSLTFRVPALRVRTVINALR